MFSIKLTLAYCQALLALSAMMGAFMSVEAL